MRRVLSFRSSFRQEASTTHGTSSGSIRSHESGGRGYASTPTNRQTAGIEHSSVIPPRAAVTKASLAAPQYSVQAKDPEGSKDAWEYVQEGLHTTLFSASQSTYVYHPLALILLLWECAQMAGFCLSATPMFPWRSLPVMADVANAFQVISFGYYIPSGTGLASAQFAIMFSLACATVLLAVGLCIADHPVLDENRLKLHWPYVPLRWLLLGCGQCLYLPMVMQLIAPLRCSATAPFLDSAVCWTSGHVALTVISAMLLPCIVILAAISVTTLFEHDLHSKDPYARGHGRVLLVIQGIKLACAALFAIDAAVDRWPLVIGAVIAQLACAYLFVIYLPFYWQRLNQLGAAGFGATFIVACVLILASARDSSLSVAPAWILIYTVPCAAMCASVFSALQWYHWLLNSTHEVSNVYQLELKIRRLLDTSDSEAVCEQIEDMFREALRFFPTTSIVHMYIAQYMHEIRRNRHLERSHLNALEARQGPLDEGFYAYLRHRRINEADESDDQRAVTSKVKFEKLKAAVREQVLSARRLQVNLWTELASSTPSSDKVLSYAKGLWNAMRLTERTFGQLLALNPNSVLVIRMYAQYLREVVSNRGKAEELMEQASEIEAMQTRAQTTEIDFVFMEKSPALDASQDNVGLLTASSVPASLGIVTDVNPVFCQIIGYSKRELLGTNINGIIPEPISSVHQRLLQAYQETGRGMMLNVTRNIFAVHKSGYLVPIVETMRASDFSFNAVAHTIITADNFILVSLPAMKITGLCQRTMVRTRISPKELRQGSVSIESMIPDFARIWQQHQQDIVQYENSALAQHDAGESYGEQLTIPLNMLYPATMCLHSKEPITFAAQIRIQYVRLSEVSFLMVRWSPVDTGNSSPHASVARASSVQIAALTEAAAEEEEEDADESADEAGSSLVGSDAVAEAGSDGELVSLSGSDDAAPGVNESKQSFTSPLNARGVRFESPRASADQYGDLSVDIPTQRSFSVDKGSKPRKSPRDPKATKSSKQAERDRIGMSGRSSQSSSSSSGFHSMLARLLSRTTQGTPPAVTRLDKAIIGLLLIGGSIVLANYVYANVTIGSASVTFDRIRATGQRVLMYGRTMLRMQDLVLDVEGFLPVSPATQVQLRSEITAALNTFEVVHRALYEAAQSDPAANAEFTSQTMRPRFLDGFGRVSVKADNPLNVGISIVSAGRLALEADPTELTRSNKHVWYLFANRDAWVTQMQVALHYYVLLAMSAMAQMAQVRLYVFLATMIGLVLLSIAVLGPLMIRIRRSREAAIAVFLDVPTTVMKALQRQSEAWLNDAVHAHDEDGEDAEMENEGTQDDETIVAALNASAGAGVQEQRTFVAQGVTMVRWLAQLFCPILLLICFLIGMFFWGQTVTDSYAKFAMEVHLGPELAVAPLTSLYNVRRAFLAGNDTALWTSTMASVEFITGQESLMMFGNPNHPFAPMTRAGLRLPDISTLFTHDGCPTHDAGCLSFYNGLFKSGLHVAVQEAVKLMEQIVINEQHRLAAGSAHPFNATYAQEAMATSAMRSLSIMAHSYLYDSLNWFETYTYAAAKSETDSYLTGLILVTIAALLVMLLGYVLFYRHLFRELAAELRIGQHMLLWMPEEILKTVPTIRSMIKQTASAV